MSRLLSVFSALLAATLGVPTAAMAADDAPPDPTTVTAVPLATWQTNGTVWAIEVVNGVAYVGGSFTKVRPPGAALGTQEVDRRFIAAFDAQTGDLLPWNPLVEGPISNTTDVNCVVVESNRRECGTVWDIKKSPDGSRIYIGGDFNKVNGSWRVGVAGFNTANGALDTVMRPGINGRVYAIAVNSTTVFAGGSFTSLADRTSRSRMAAFSRSTGETLPFAPVVSGNVRKMTMSPDGTRVIVGGWFDTINGVGPRRLSAVHADTGLNAPWADNRFSTAAWVTDLKTVDGLVYVAGEAQGTVNEGVDVYDPTTGQRVWTDGCRGASHSLAVLRGVVYTGSHAHNCITMEGGFPEQYNSQDPETQRRYKLRAEIPFGTTAKLLPWTPQTDDGNGPRAMATVGDDILWVGGEFRVVNDNISQQGLTRFGFADRGAQRAAPRAPSTPTAFSTRPGSVTITFPTGEDRDSRMVKYQVLRNGNGAAPVHEVTLASRPWAPGWYSWIDESVVPGQTYTYELRGEDLEGNRGPRSGVATVVVAQADPPAVEVPKGEAARINYRLNETSGPARDSVAAVRTANAGSGATFGVAGVPNLPGTAVRFSGSSGGTLGDPTREWGKKQISVELWFNTTTNRGGKLIGMGTNSSVTSTSTNSDRNIYLTNDGRVAWGLNPGTRTAVFSPAGLNDGRWHHVVGTLDAVAGMSLYVDGAKVAANPNVTWSNALNGYWRIGGDTLASFPDRPSSDYFAGVIDEVALYPYPLTEAQALRHFRLGAGVSDTTPPSVPGGVSASASGQDVTVSWSASTDDDAVAGYRVYRGSTPGFTPDAASLVGEPTVLQFVESAVAFGTWYYRVAAVDATGNESPVSDSVSVDVVAPPPAPVTVVASQDTWVNSGAPTATAGSSWVMRARGGSPEQVSYLRFRLPDAVPGRTLQTAVLRLSTSGNSFAGSSAAFDVRLVADNSWQEGTLTWTNRPAVSSTVLGTIPGGTVPSTQYEVALAKAQLAPFVGQDVSIAIIGPSTDTLELQTKESPSGKPNLTVVYDVEGAPDSTPPSVPGGVSASASGRDVTVAWSASTDDRAVAGYRVYRGSSAGFEANASSLIGEPTGLQFVDPGVAVGTWYYRVAAVDSSGNASAASGSVSAVVLPPPDSTPPSVPGGVSASASGQDVTVAWSASTDDRAVAGYRVYRGSSAGFEANASSLIGEPTGLQFVDPGVAVGTWYYRVAAVDTSGNASAASESVSAVVTAPPQPVALVAAQDSWVNSGSTSATAGSSWVMRARGGSPEQVSYLRFRLPDPVAGRTMQSTVLRLATSENSWAGSAAAFEVRLVEDSTWQEATLTWATRPAVSSTVLGTLAGGTVPSSEFDVVLSAAQLAAFAGREVSLAIVGPSTDNVELRTKESPTGKPTLTIRYN